MVAFTLGVSAIQTENVVEVGERVEERLFRLVESLPAGIEVLPIYEQHRVVDEAIGRQKSGSHTPSQNSRKTEIVC